MAVKRLEVPEIGEVTLQKRRGTRSVRIHINGNEVRVTLPHWISYSQALKFIQTRKKWIKENRKEAPFLTHGTYVGKQHRITLEEKPVKNIRSKLKSGVIAVSAPHSTDVSAPSVQMKLGKIAERALLKESEALIKPRIEDLALEYDFDYGSISFKKLKTRWGSCDHESNIVINIYLVQLPWQLIDYVLVHELAHTKHHDHSPKFWSEVEECLPNFKDLRKQMKKFHPHIITD